MFTQLNAEIIPQQLRGVALVGTNQMPRYWPNIWILMAGHDWATSTQTVRLRYVESLYEHADRLWRPNVLDDALSALDGQALADILESWFISLRNQAVQTRSNEARWRTGLGFVTSVVTWLKPPCWYSCSSAKIAGSKPSRYRSMKGCRSIFCQNGLPVSRVYISRIGTMASSEYQGRIRPDSHWSFSVLRNGAVIFATWSSVCVSDSRNISGTGCAPSVNIRLSDSSSCCFSAK